MKLTENFNLIEFHCKDGTRVPYENLINVYKLSLELQKIREQIKVPIHINSAYRTPEHNKKVGGVENSYHLQGLAADISTKQFTPEKLYNIISEMINNKIIIEGGLFLYPGFIHYDIRGFKAR